MELDYQATIIILANILHFIIHFILPKFLHLTNVDYLNNSLVVNNKKTIDLYEFASIWSTNKAIKLQILCNDAEV